MSAAIITTRDKIENGLRRALRELSMLGLQSEQYHRDMDFRDAVDNGLALTTYPQKSRREEINNDLG